MTVKLGWLLAQEKSYDEIKNLMITDMRGEINVAQELSGAPSTFGWFAEPDWQP